MQLQYVLLALFSAASANIMRSGNFFTPLKNDEHPCVAENLKESHRYICDDEANVICLSGWKDPDDEELRDLKNPCPQPICDYDGKTCKYGDCVRPNVCACKVGWEGHLCDRCVPLPGCDHGSCENAFECNCIQNSGGTYLYEGAFCDRPACPDSMCDPAHGQCFEPLSCTCHEGWEGSDCKTCKKLPGCVNGKCVDDKPNTCECYDGWQGHLCDEPICKDGCHKENGYCEEPNTCLCKTGWKGDLCDNCAPYWDCPIGGRCVEPNQCICDAGVTNNGYCNRDIMNGPMYEEFGDCSNPCKTEAEIESDLGISAGVRIRRCRWEADGPCNDQSQACYGSRDWVRQVDGTSDPANCIYVARQFTVATNAPPPNNGTGAP